MPKKYSGFVLIPILIFVGLLIVGFIFLRPKGNSTPNSIGEIIQKAKEKTTQSDCPDPFVFQLPIDINKATSVLYPGQIRGGDYKAHGGFRFDKSLPNEITVTGSQSISTLSL